MRNTLNLLRGALTLDMKTFEELKASPDVFRKGFTFLLVVGLFVGLILGLAGIVQGLLSNPATEIANVRQQMEQIFSSMMPAEASGQFTENFRLGFRIAERIVREMKTPLPRPVGVIFQNIGIIVSYPFGWLGSLLFYGVIVHIIAKLFGGRGTIGQMLGLTSLSVAPHLLDALNFIPCLNLLTGLIALIWGAVVYVKATATAQEMTTGKATLVVFTPVLIGVALFFCSLATLGVMIAASGGQ